MSRTPPGSARSSRLLAVNQHSFPRETELTEALALARKAGFDAIEPVVRAEGELSDASAPSEVRTARERAREHGLSIETLSSDVWFRKPLTDPDPDVRRAGLGTALRLVDMTADIGAGVLHVIPGMVDMPLVRPDYPPTPYADAFARARDAVQQLAEHAAGVGVQIGIENVWNRFLQSPYEMRQLIESALPADAGAEANAPVGALFDVGNCLLVGYPEHWIPILAPHLLRVHVKDFRRAAAGAAGFVPPFMGDVSWSAVVAALVEADYAGPLTVEVPPGARDPLEHLEQLARDLRRLREMLRARAGATQGG